MSKKSSLLFLGMLTAFLLVFSIFAYTKSQLVNGALVKQNVLGDEDENKQAEEAKEEEKKAEEKAAEEQKTAEEKLVEEIKLNTQNEQDQSETELETANGQKIKTKVEDDGTTKIEIEREDLKIQYETRNGQTEVKAEDESGEKVELNEDESGELQEEIEDELEDEGVKIATSGAGQLTFAKNQIAATTSFPLSIDIGTKQLIVTTPAGQRVVTVLPDQAVANLLATGIIDQFDGSLDELPLETNNLGEIKGIVKFEIRNGLPVYEIAGFKKYRLLAIFPVTQPVTTVVSSETGEVIDQNKSLLATVVDWLSP